MDTLDCLEPCDLVILSTLLTFLISEDLSADDLNIIGNFIVSVGGLVLTWAAQKERVSKSADAAGNPDAASLEELKKQILCLQKKCDSLEPRCRAEKQKFSVG